MNVTHFSTVSLEELDAVALQNRVDTKFVFPAAVAAQILAELSKEYAILEHQSRRSTRYATEYHDTENDAMYHDHHNGKAHRFKIRKRRYVESDQQFLEVKRKTNTGRTIKKRMVLSADDSQERERFLSCYAPYDLQTLVPKMNSEFERITLVNKERGERVTIDTNLIFADNIARISLDFLTVLEIKTSSQAMASPLVRYLKTEGIYPSRFSKYCMGRALLDRSLKQNRFKEQLLFLSKMNHSSEKGTA